MTGYTPIYNLPYPQASDLVSAYPGTGQDLAEEVETVLAAKAPLTSAVLQIVTGNTDTVATSSSTTLADTGLTATITPSETTSKILVFVTQNGVAKDSGATGNAVRLRLLRGATAIADVRYHAYTVSSLFNGGHSWACTVLDSPATTSAVTYKTQYANETAAAQVFVQYSGGLGGTKSFITLIEIAG